MNKIDFKKYAKCDQITAEELLASDDNLECSEDLTNQEIFELTTHKEVPEEIYEINNEKITNKEVRICIDKLFNYCEQNN